MSFSSSSSSSSTATPGLYPMCDTSNIQDPCLNTWIEQGTFRSFIIDCDGPTDHCAEIPPNAHPGGNKKNRIMKHLELRKTRFNSGYATYFYDFTDTFLLNEFEAEVK